MKEHLASAIIIKELLLKPLEQICRCLYFVLKKVHAWTETSILFKNICLIISRGIDNSIIQGCVVPVDVVLTDEVIVLL